MKSRTVYVSFLLGAAAVVGGTVAIAQPAQGEVSAGEETKSNETKDGQPKSPQEILAEAQFTVDRMEATADNISRMLRAAREEKDVVKTLCLDDKVNQVNVAVRAAADRLAVIEAGVDSGSTDRLDHDQSVLGALGGRAQELAVEANQCIGEEGGVVGESELNVQFDPSLPEGNVADSPTSQSIISQPPVASSPTL